MSRTPSYEYEVLHQFEVIFRDGEHKTQAATRDYQRVWENVIDNPPEEGVTPIVVYRMNGSTCAAIAGLDDLVDNEECAMEIARLAARVAELEEKYLGALGTLRVIGHAVGCEGDELAVLATVRRVAGELATLRAHPDELETTKLAAAYAESAKLRVCVEAYVVPVAALVLDDGNRELFAPEVWDALVAADVAARAALDAKGDGEEPKVEVDNG